MTPFGLKLKNVRQKRGLNQSALADILGVQVRIVSAAETGRGRPFAPDLLALLSRELALPTLEAEELSQAAELSQQHLKVPSCATPLEIELLNKLVRSIETLPRGRRQALCASLEAFV